MINHLEPKLLDLVEFFLNGFDLARYGNQSKASRILAEDLLS